MSFPSSLGLSGISFRVIFILCCLRAGVYPVLGAGWASNSKYALLGRLRSVAQTISYEVSLAFILLGFIVILRTYSLNQFLLYSRFQWIIFLSLPLGVVWFVTSLAETNRTPFDFSEGESELVSGFNTEFSSGSFALFFLAEYGRILFIRLFFSVVFLGGLDTALTFPVKITAIVSLFIWVRGTLPRLRYDKLIMLAWKIFLPVSLSYLIYFSSLACLFSRLCYYSEYITQNRPAVSSKCKSDILIKLLF